LVQLTLIKCIEAGQKRGLRQSIEVHGAHGDGERKTRDAKIFNRSWLRGEVNVFGSVMWVVVSRSCE